MSEIEIVVKYEKLVIDSRLIAQKLDIQHKNFLANIEQYEEEAVAEGFLPLAFETREFKTRQGNTSVERWAWLDEEWANYAMTLSRNTPEVRAAKRGLVKAFSAAKQKLAQKQPSKVETIQDQEATEQIKNTVAEWLGHIFAKTRVLVNEVSRESDRCFALIVKKAADEQIDLVNAIKKGVDQIELEVMARGAINRIVHRVPHQPGKITKVIDEQVHAHQEEFVQMLVAQLMALQVLKQPALPPALEFPVQRTSSDRRRAVIAKIFDLIEEYGSLEAIPRRGRGKAGINLEVEWGALKLSQMFGVSPNTVLAIWGEVEESIKQYGEAEARQRLL